MSGAEFLFENRESGDGQGDWKKNVAHDFTTASDHRVLVCAVRKIKNADQC